jgi:hypothetical protein
MIFEPSMSRSVNKIRELMVRSAHYNQRYFADAERERAAQLG